ncbi:hypothetical protein ACIG56_22945 [Nocardia fusca]|uniref:hypothetical protein n=1 Tax=Nocardia fusca TaxID=941183 RepID=UPI0037CCA582
MNAIEVHGTVATGYEEVRAEFAAVVTEEDGESGAQPAAFVRGRKVVDLRAGREVSGTSLTGLHSTTKGAARATIATVSAIHSSGPDLVRGDRAPYTLGFEAKSLLYPFLGAHAFGHTGSAGSDGFADPHSGLAYGYTRRRAAFAFNAPENARLAAAIYHAATGTPIASAA